MSHTPEHRRSELPVLTTLSPEVLAAARRRNKEQGFGRRPRGRLFRRARPAENALRDQLRTQQQEIPPEAREFVGGAFSGAGAIAPARETLAQPAQEALRQQIQRPEGRASVTVGGQTFTTTESQQRSGQFEREQGAALREAFTSQTPLTREQQGPISTRVNVPQQQAIRQKRQEELFQKTASPVDKQLIDLGLPIGGSPEIRLQGLEIALKIKQLKEGNAIELLEITNEIAKIKEVIRAAKAAEDLAKAKLEQEATTGEAERDLTKSEGELGRAEAATEREFTAGESRLDRESKERRETTRAEATRQLNDIRNTRPGFKFQGEAIRIRIDRKLLAIEDLQTELLTVPAGPQGDAERTRIQDKIDKLDEDVGKEVDTLSAVGQPEVQAGQAIAQEDLQSRAAVDENLQTPATPQATTQPSGAAPLFPGEDNAVIGQAYTFPDGSVGEYRGNGKVLLAQ